MATEHFYKINTVWTGNSGNGTKNYRAYERSFIIKASGKVDIDGTSDTAFNSDKSKHNPEELFLSAISSCHLLWYLHVCSQADVSVLAYQDEATGTMLETADGGGHFTEVILHVNVTVSHSSMAEKAMALHEKANQLCYIANSCNFPIRHLAVVIVA
ncbi:MAG: OsmC family protein [Ferruginibacter sp.]